MTYPHTSKFFTRAGILGLGLIGGSWARALKQRGIRVVASDESRSSHAARDAGVVDELVKFPHGFEGCDLLLLCSPPSAVCETLPKLMGLNIGLITDVCSVKQPIMDAAHDLKNFIADSNSFMSVFPLMFLYKFLPERSVCPILPNTLPSGDVNPSIAIVDPAGFTSGDIEGTPYESTYWVAI